jgi:outer membrane lipoprotein
MSNWKLALTAAAALTLGACATIPQPLQGTYAQQVTPQNARGGQANGSPVRWGGQIIKTDPGPGHTCFYVLAHPLDNVARPDGNKPSLGRFVACHSGFYDPQVFTRGREVTFTGALHGIVTHKVGNYDYPYPRVEATTVYLWPKRPVYTAYPRSYYDPFRSPFWGPAWGPYYDPFWYSPRVIVVPRPAPAPPPKKK